LNGGSPWPHIVVLGKEKKELKRRKTETPNRGRKKKTDRKKTFQTQQSPGKFTRGLSGEKAERPPLKWREEKRALKFLWGEGGHPRTFKKKGPPKVQHAHLHHRK